MKEIIFYSHYEFVSKLMLPILIKFNANHKTIRKKFNCSQIVSAIKIAFNRTFPICLHPQTQIGAIIPSVIFPNGSLSQLSPNNLSPFPQGPLSQWPKRRPNLVTRWPATRSIGQNANYNILLQEAIKDLNIFLLFRISCCNRRCYFFDSLSGEKSPLYDIGCPLLQILYSICVINSARSGASKSSLPLSWANDLARSSGPTVASGATASSVMQRRSVNWSAGRVLQGRVRSHASKVRLRHLIWRHKFVTGEKQIHHQSFTLLFFQIANFFNYMGGN